MSTRQHSERNIFILLLVLILHATTFRRNLYEIVNRLLTAAILSFDSNVKASDTAFFIDPK